MALGTPVKLDIRLIEADQVTTPSPTASRRDDDGFGEYPFAVDGIEFDSFGNPAVYHVLTSHPGASGNTWSVGQDFERAPAARMIHWFRTDRPGQHRGLPDILPALPLFAQLRRYTLAVIAAAESAANVAIFMKTNTPAGGEAAEVAPKTEMEFTPNMAVFGPEGWEPMQIKAEQPATTYAEFKREILNEIARCLNMPFNVAACNSSGYNYSSGRLDHQTYHKSVRVEQDHLEDVVLDRILYMWLAEAVQVYPELAALKRPAAARDSDSTNASDSGLTNVSAVPRGSAIANASVVVNVSAGVDVLEGVIPTVPHQWFWDGREHIDPAKEANAQATRLANNTTTLATEFAKQGKDWETEVRQRAREVTLCRTLGLTLALPAPQPADTQEQQAADVGVTMMSADIYAIARHDPGATFPWVSPWELRDNQFDGAVVDSARATALLLSCDDEPALCEYLVGEGLTIRQPGDPASPTRALPDFLVGVTAYEYADAYCQADQDVLENVDPPAGVTVLRFVNRSNAAAQFALAHPDREFLAIADANGLSVETLRVLAGSNVVGVIVGHYRHADDEPVDFAASAADVLRVTRAVRLVSDAPVLLAVGAVNIHTRDTEHGWAEAFGDDLKTFDGFALYGLARFPAILEAVENPRELIMRRMGLPDRPCILIEFVGTSFQYAADERGYVEKVWAAKAKPLLAALKKQQWQGLVTWSATTDDARIKADALRNVMQAQPQAQPQNSPQGPPR